MSFQGNELHLEEQPIIDMMRVVAAGRCLSWLVVGGGPQRRSSRGGDCRYEATGGLVCGIEREGASPRAQAYACLLGSGWLSPGRSTIRDRFLTRLGAFAIY